MDLGDTSFKLQDRTALICGSTTSFNQAIAMKLTQMGCNVAIIDRNMERSQRFTEQLMDAREINDRFGRAVAIQADLSKLYHVEDAINKAAEAFGGIDIYIDGLLTTEAKPFAEPKSIEDLDRVIDINLRSPIMTTHAVLRYLSGRKRGRIIYLLHDIASQGLPKHSLLAATRSGLMQFAKSISREVAESNVTVNCVAMGITEEFLLAPSPEPLSIQAAQKKLQEAFPYAVLTEPERIANLVLFLASPMGAGITGQTIAANQGLSFIS
jgi:2-hydroxycyclohexanecarboxyl-CoA dehydrogenase